MPLEFAAKPADLRLQFEANRNAKGLSHNK